MNADHRVFHKSLMKLADMAQLPEQQTECYIALATKYFNMGAETAGAS